MKTLKILFVLLSATLVSCSETSEKSTVVEKSVPKVSTLRGIDMTSRYEVFSYSDPKEVEPKLTEALKLWSEACFPDKEPQEYESVQFVFELTEGKLLLPEYSFFNDKEELIETLKFNKETKIYDRIAASSGEPSESGVKCPPGYGYLGICNYNDIYCPGQKAAHYMTAILAEGKTLPKVAVLVNVNNFKLCASPPPTF